MDKKNDKNKQESKPRDDGVELENQIIMRLPEEPAKVLQEALLTGNLKDRMAIKLDNELRYGEVRFDQWLLHAKVVDLPTIVESHKTIDSKNFYKSSDICQMMICKEDPDPIEEKESPNKSKKKDPNKVDKKYLWPHGITPPCKNVRKRRFRKTLKKKNVEAPEIEKEVKRLLRIDNDAERVDYELISEDIDKPIDQNSKEYNEGEDEFNEDATINESDGKIKENDLSSQKDVNVETDDEDAPTGSAPTLHGGVGEHDIFGEEVSSSDDEMGRPDANRGSREIEESSRLSAEDSRMSDFSISGATGVDVGNESRADDSNLPSTKDDPTEFNKLMFKNSPKLDIDPDKSNSNFGDSNSNLAAPSNYFDVQKQNSSTDFKDDFDLSDDGPQPNVDEIKTKIVELRRQFDDFKAQHSQKAQEISSIQNQTLRQRMQETLDNLASQMVEKELEIKDYENML